MIITVCNKCGGCIWTYEDSLNEDDFKDENLKRFICVKCRTKASLLTQIYNWILTLCKGK